MIEIRWHGRGGQGAKTASQLLADAAFMSGKYVQSFPEYGPERSGAPITAYNRISDERCLIHSNIYEPDYVAVVDETLLKSVDVTSGLKEDGAVIINSEKFTNEELAAMTPEQRAHVKDLRQQLEDFRKRFYAQFKNPDAEAPLEKKPRPGSIKLLRKQYAKLDNFIQAIIRERSKRSN